MSNSYLMALPSFRAPDIEKMSGRILSGIVLSMFFFASFFTRNIVLSAASPSYALLLTLFVFYDFLYLFQKFKQDESANKSYLELSHKFMQSAISIVAMFLTYFYLIDFPSPFWFDMVLLTCGILFCVNNLCKVIFEKNNSLQTKFIDVFFALTMIIGMLIYFNPCGILSFLPNISGLAKLSYFCFFPLFGVFVSKEAKAVFGTFDFNKFPKYVLGFFLGLLSAFLFHWNLSTKIELLPFVNPGLYLLYLCLVIPLAINKTLAESYIYQSCVLYIKERWNINAAVCCLLVFAIAAFSAYRQLSHYGTGFMPLMFCFAMCLPKYLGRGFVSFFSGGIEYSAGDYFGSDLFIFALAPVFVFTLGFDSITWGFVGYIFCFSSCVSLLFLIPTSYIESFFELKVTDSSNKPQSLEDYNKNYEKDHALNRSKGDSNEDYREESENNLGIGDATDNLRALKSF